MTIEERVAQLGDLPGAKLAEPLTLVAADGREIHIGLYYNTALLEVGGEVYALSEATQAALFVQPSPAA